MLCAGVAFGSVALRIFLQDPFYASIGTSLCGEHRVYVALWTTQTRSQRAVAFLERQQGSERQGRGVDIGPYSEAIAKHRAKMRDPALRELLKQRSRIVEPVFAQIKENGGFRRWTTRGLKNVQAQWSMLCGAWNLQKIFQVWQLKGDDLRLKPA
jgi:Transposase DDE domain